jgi:adenylate cyclase
MFFNYLSRQRRTIQIGLFVTFLILLMQNFGADNSILQRINGLIYDLRLKTMLEERETDTTILVLDIDERSLEKEGRWPWSRVKVAQMIEKMAEAGAVVIAFDVMFTEPERNPVNTVIDLLNQQPNQKTLIDAIVGYREQADADMIMAASLESTDVILGMLFQDETNAKIGKMQDSVITFDTEDRASIYSLSFTGHVSNIPILQENSPGIGFINSTPQEDGFIRNTSLLAKYGDEFYPSLALEAARLYALADSVQVMTADEGGGGRTMTGLKIGRKIIPTDKFGRVLVPYKGPAKSYPYISATDLLHGNINPEIFDSAIVFVGTSAVGNADLRATPVGIQYPGVEVHANVIDGLLHPHYIPAKPDWSETGILAIILLVGLVLSLYFPSLGPLAIGLNGILIIGALIWLDFYTWSALKTSLDLATTYLLGFTLTILNIAIGYFTESGKRKQIKGIFDQYVPPAHIDAMLEHPELLDTSGIRKEMSVLFSDIRSFTSISEKLTANELATLLNRYFSPITKSIFEHHGTIDKYVGDMVMAFWNAPLNDEHHVQNAINCAFEMLEITEYLSREFEKEGWPEIKVGVGINTGEMNVGDMGSEYRRAYTVLGDAVNLGSRLEGLTKYYGVDLLVNETCLPHCPNMTFRPIDKVRVKGKHKAVSIFEPITPKLIAQSQTVEELEQYHDAYQSYLDQDWPTAVQKFTALAGINPNRKVYSIYLERIDILKGETLEADWDGSFTHTSK